MDADFVCLSDAVKLINTADASYMLTCTEVIGYKMLVFTFVMPKLCVASKYGCKSADG